MLSVCDTWGTKAFHADIYMYQHEKVKVLIYVITSSCLLMLYFFFIKQPAASGDVALSNRFLLVVSVARHVQVSKNKKYTLLVSIPLVFFQTSTRENL